MTLISAKDLRLIPTLLVLLAAAAPAPAVAQEATDPYPLGLELRVLARDLTSDEYHEVLETMIPTDLAAEWQRVATPDNHITFLEKHGGKDKVLADPRLKAAYEERVRIAEQFLDLMREAYKKRNQRPPFEPVEVERLLTRAGERAVAADPELSVPVRVVMPAPGAERQWPRFRGPTGQGTAIETDFPLTWSDTENVVWKSKLPGKGSSSPVVWDDRIFITAASEDGRERLLLCYSRDTGDLVWKQAAPRPPESERLYWKNTYASSTPVTDGERVIAFFGNSGMICCDMDGSLQWHQPLGPFITTHGPGTSPVLYKDKVILIQYQNRGDSVFVAVHTYRDMPFREYFLAAEEIFLRHDGRPHWGKVHSLHGDELRRRYPRWDDFLAVREEVDPDGLMLSPYLARLLGL
jgi:outer membrane protein assembly factor BamB